MNSAGFLNMWMWEHQGSGSDGGGVTEGENTARDYWNWGRGNS